MREKKIDPKTMCALDELKAVPARDPAAAARARTNFLKEAASLRQATSRKATASHVGWFTRLFPPFPLRSPRPAFNTLMAVFLALAVFLGGSGVMVAAAQESLPDQALYTLKTWSEDAVVTLAPSSVAKLDYNLSFSDRRIAEMENLVSSGKPTPEKVAMRLQTELEAMLELAASMGDNDMRLQVEQMRLRAEGQLQRLGALSAGAPGTNSPALVQAQEYVREQVRWCELGLADPQGFRQQLRLRLRNHTGSGRWENTPTGTPQGPAGNQSPSENGFGPGAGNGPQKPGGAAPTATPILTGTQGPCPNCDSATPTPGSPAPEGNGPGPGGNQPTTTPGVNGPGTGGNKPTVTPGGNGPGPDGRQPTATP